MCLAVAGKIIQIEGPSAQVDVGGNQINVTVALCPGIEPGDHILIHAGFAIAKISAKDYQQQTRIMQDIDNYARKIIETD